MARTALTRYRKRSAVTVALLASVAMAPIGTYAEQGAPLESHPTQLGRMLETANHLPGNGVQVTVGTAQTAPGSGPGTGNQIYYLGADYAPTDRLTFGIHAETFEDPVTSPINGLFPAFGMDTASGSIKYKLIDGDRLDVSVQGAVEFFRFETSVFGTDTGTDAEHIIGSIKAPISYAMSDELQFHLTPGVSFFPDDLNGTPFYGTVGYVGAGLSYRPNERIAGYAAVNVPVAGGNTVSSTGTITTTPVWVVGGRYNATPKIGVDVYATNGIGTTPTTGILSYWPSGDEILYGARIVWTPGEGPGYRPSYRNLSPVTPRQRSLQHDGFTLSSADTHEPGSFAGTAWYGTGDNYGAGIILAPDQDGQMEGYIEQYSNDGSVPAALLPSQNERYMFGLKLRLNAIVQIFNELQRGVAGGGHTRFQHVVSEMRLPQQDCGFLAQF